MDTRTPATKRRAMVVLVRAGLFTAASFAAFVFRHALQLGGRPFLERRWGDARHAASATRVAVQGEAAVRL
jgi:hypothetical protein